MSPSPSSRGRKTHQARSAARQEDMRAAAARLLIDEGPHAITHRGVAEAAQVPPGSAAYYYPTREGLYAAAVEAAEELRANAAHDLAQALDTRHRSQQDVARLLIETWYAPKLRDDVVSVRLEPMLAAVRQEGLSDIMAQSRPRHLESLAEVLRRSGYPKLAASEDLNLVAMMIDAALLYAATTGQPPIDRATSAVARLLELAQSNTDLPLT